MEAQHFHHALKVNTELCYGCTRCMKACPTEAIRIRNGKATIIDNHCVDCGQCYRTCPVTAIYVEQDDFSNIFNFPYRVALVPAVLTGQFFDGVTSGKVLSAIHSLGFTHVYEVENAVEILSDAINRHIGITAERKPVISSFCPAIVRLIQVRFPSLCNHIMQLKAPLDISAISIKKELMDSGIPENQIGIFYITPCAAKIAAVKSPVGEDKSAIDGVINLNSLYNRIMQQLKNHSAPAAKEDDIQDQLSPKSILWSLTGGEADQYQGRSFAVDGIDNIIEFLDKLENEEIEWIDFLELRACDQSCAGGILVHGNRFLIVDKMKKRAVVQRINQKNATSDVASAHRSYLFDSVRINPIEPRPLIRLDSDPAEALKKMQYYREILKTLPGLDCGACGAPNCQVHAEDIARGESSLERCVFVYNKNKNQSEITENPENPNVIERIWGKSRFQQNKLKDQL